MKKFHQLFFLLTSILLFGTIEAQQTPVPLKLVDFVLTPDHDDWNYNTNQQANIKVTVLRFGVPVKNATVEYEVGPELLAPDKKGSLVFKNGEGNIEIGTSKNPGFRRLVVRTSVNGNIYSGEI